MIAPPPMPCSTRNSTSDGRFHDSPHSALAIVKIRTEVEK